MAGPPGEAMKTAANPVPHDGARRGNELRRSPGPAVGIDPQVCGGMRRAGGTGGRFLGRRGSERATCPPEPRYRRPRRGITISKRMRTRIAASSTWPSSMLDSVRSTVATWTAVCSRRRTPSCHSGSGTVAAARWMRARWRSPTIRTALATRSRTRRCRPPGPARDAARVRTFRRRARPTPRGDVQAAARRRGSPLRGGVVVANSRSWAVASSSTCATERSPSAPRPRRSPSRGRTDRPRCRRSGGASSARRSSATGRPGAAPGRPSASTRSPSPWRAARWSPSSATRSA